MTVLYDWHLNQRPTGVTLLTYHLMYNPLGVWPVQSNYDCGYDVAGQQSLYTKNKQWKIRKEQTMKNTQFESNDVWLL